MTSTRLAERVSLPDGPRAVAAPRPGVRRQILDAALVEFAARGFQEASLAAIARHVGVTAPLVLYHFGSKANLWREAVEVFCAGFAAVVDEAVEGGAGLEGREALRRLVRRLVHFFAANHSGYRLMRDEGAGGSDSNVSTNLRPSIERIRGLYARAVEEGELRPVPFETAFFMILGALSCYLESQTLAAHLFGEAKARQDWIDDYAEQVVGFCFEGLSLPPRRAAAARPMLAALRAASTPATEERRA
jgi:TetR/AcrR family transcriptional regulator